MTVVAWWLGLLVVEAVSGPRLSSVWPGWHLALIAAALWGINGLLAVYAIGRPYRISRPPHLVAGFAFLMTLFGSGSYWATIEIYPGYRVSIERAALLVAGGTALTLVSAWFVGRVAGPVRSERPFLTWNWQQLRAVNVVLFALACIGTLVSIRRIGYIPLLTGDPTSARVEFPAIGGIWYRLSMLGGVVALVVAAQVAARRATALQSFMGIVSLGLVGLYGPRFFVALPLGVAVLLWDRLRKRISLLRALVLFLVIAPALAVVGYWRERDPHLGVLGPLGLTFYGTLGEFRDLGWTMDYYGFGDRYLHGATLGSVVVPVLPSPIWQVVGIDKARIYAQSSASMLADAMGQTTGQRVGVYGEFFMNYGWVGACCGAIAFGLLIGYLDRQLSNLQADQVRAVFLGVATAAAVFALIGQLDMFTSTLTGLGYPLAVVAFFVSRRQQGTRSGAPALL